MIKKRNFIIITLIGLVVSSKAQKDNVIKIDDDIQLIHL